MSSNQVLTKKDVYEASWRWMQVGIGTFNYETQLALTNQYALRKALRKIYPNDEDYKAVMHNHGKYFNTQPYLSSVVMGAALGMEEQLGVEGMEAIQNFKVGLMGPLAGIGDTLFWIVLPAIFTPIEAAMAYDGNLVGVIITLVKAIIVGALRWHFFYCGYKAGTAAILNLRDQLQTLTDCASILGLTVVGALIPSLVSVVCPLQFTTATGGVIAIQTYLDMIMPKLLAVVITGTCYFLLGKKKIKMTTLVFGVLIFSVIASALGILG